MRQSAVLVSTVAAALVAGFILGGLKIYGGDPGLGIILVPVGALALFAAVYFAASAASAQSAVPPKGK